MMGQQRIIEAGGVLGRLVLLVAVAAFVLTLAIALASGPALADKGDRANPTPKDSLTFKSGGGANSSGSPGGGGSGGHFVLSDNTVDSWYSGGGGSKGGGGGGHCYISSCVGSKYDLDK